jgi:hypothetical protein
MANWNYDVGGSSGSSRDSALSPDTVFEDPSGQRAIVFYSCVEIREGFTVGHVAVLSGDPEAPHMDLVPSSVLCEVAPVIWASGRYATLRPPVLDPELEKTERPLMILDFETKAWTLMPFEADARLKVFEANMSWFVEEWRPSSQKREGQSVSPGALSWLDWSEIGDWQRMYLADHFGRPLSYRRAIQDQPSKMDRWVIRLARKVRDRFRK